MQMKPIEGIKQQLGIIYIFTDEASNEEELNCDVCTFKNKK